MKKLIPALILSAFYATTYAQTQPFGKVDMQDLQLKECEFEKDANAMILFDKGTVFFDDSFDIILERHKRIKIFNEKGKGEGDVRVEFYNRLNIESIYNIQAQTINLVNGKPEITKVDKKLIYTQTIDKNNSAIVFSFPNVQAGSVLEFKYTWKTPSFTNFPDWQFQKSVPARYSEIETSIPDFFYYRVQSHTYQQLSKNSKTVDSKSIGIGANAIVYSSEHCTRAIINIPSLPDEPYMTSTADNTQAVLFQLVSIRPITTGLTTTFADTWAKVGGVYADDEDFGLQIRKKLDGEDVIIAKAKTLATNEAKIAYIFNEVKNLMKWNGQNRAVTNDGTPKAWEKKTGNSTEINLILCHLLKQAGLTAYPMLTSTRDHGRVYIAYPSAYQFNKAVVYIPIDSIKRYVLDATDKYQSYSQIPADVLNSSGLYFDKETKIFDIISLSHPTPVTHMTLVDANVLADGKLDGTAQISSSTYNKVRFIKHYKTDGEEKYKEYLQENDATIKISAVKLDNTDIDSLPLVQTITFRTNAASADGEYIYFSPNLFSSMRTNPFLSENRYTDIDFGYRNNFSINGTFKLPAGYKIEALPKSVSLNMPDNSISFRRIIAEQEGKIAVRYTVDFKKSVYFKEDYGYVREFYKKMYEMLNEQIVLKKS